MKWFVALVLIVACASARAQEPTIKEVRPTGPILNENFPPIAPFVPARIYGRWLGEIAACEGLPLPTQEQIAVIRFVEVNASTFEVTMADGTEGDRALGAADFGANLIYISFARVYDRDVVVHEFVHWLLHWKNPKYIGGHPKEYFTKCGLHGDITPEADVNDK